MIDTESVDTSSAKGLKSADNLVILGGTFHFDTSDDTLHSNNYLGIKSGEILITSGDDGIHADSELIIDSGIINILKSYEGLEAAKITINGGDISVVSSDDGINVAGGNDSSSMNRPGENQYRENTDNKLIINEGIISVNATGDGIDVNGSAYMYGGKVVVLGPTNDGNGTLDYDLEFIVDGGEMIATGSSGMLQMISSDNQYNVIVAFSNQYQENTKISILDDNNKEIISHTPTKSFSSLILSSPFLEKGKNYKLEIDEEIYQTFEIKEYTTTIGRVSNHQMPGGGNMGGGRR